MIEFRTLGVTSLVDSKGDEIHPLLAQPKRVALLAYLCVAKPRTYHRRDSLLALLWPDADESRARNSLRNAVHVLRKSLGDSAIMSRGDDELCVSERAVWCDAPDFEQKAASNDPVSALDLYRGDFLPGFFLSDVPLFERWMEDHRGRLRRIAAEAASHAAQANEKRGDFTAAITFSRRSLELAELDERALRQLISLLLRVGDRASAITAFDSFSKRLRAEYDEEPSAETQQLLQQPAAKMNSHAPSDTNLHRKEPENGHAPSDLSARPSDHSIFAQEPDRWAATPQEKNWKRWIGAGLIAGAVLVAAVFSRVPSSAVPTPAIRHVRQLTYTGKAIQSTLSPDGEFLAYTEQVGDSVRIMVKDVAVGGRAGNVATVNTVSTIEWSPNGKRLLVGGFDEYTNHGLVLIAPRLGGIPQHITVAENVGANMRAFWVPSSDSSDERISVHADWDKRVLLVDTRTQDTAAFSVDGDYDWLADGSWSPDGTVFAVVTELDRSARWSIRLASRARQAEVVVDSVLLGSPRWSRSGDALYYARGNDEIWRVPVSLTTGLNTGPPQQVYTQLGMLLPKTGLPYFSTASSADMLSFPRGYQFSNVFNVELAPQKTRTPLTAGSALRWGAVGSPDGKWIAYAQSDNGVAELYKVPRTGGMPTQITFGAQVLPQANIAWAPDGASIAFISSRDHSPRVWIAETAANRLRVLPRSRSNAYPAHLAWAPGKRIAYQNAQMNVILVDPATGEEAPLANVTHPWFMSPQYSFDGRYLAVAWNRGIGDLGVWIFDVTGVAPPKKIANRWFFPRGWSRDGRYLYASLCCDRAVFRIATSGNEDPQPVIEPGFFAGQGDDVGARSIECSIVPRVRRETFVCSAFSFVSDVWLIDHFSSSTKPDRRVFTPAF